MKRPESKILFFKIFSLVLVFASSLQITAEYHPITADKIYFDIGKPFQLSCSTDEKVNIVWKKDENDVADVFKEHSEHYKIHTEGTKSTFKIKYGQDTDEGNYSCEANEKTRAFVAITNPQVRVKPKDVSVVDGERLTLKCNVLGSQIQVNWILPFNYSEERVRYENNEKIDNGTLIIDHIKMSDRGYYKCEASHKDGIGKVATDKAFVRVKDKYAALWPFIFICIEVFILCLIILIYEKKRNKTEVDDSETDIAPDVKNGKK